MSHVPSQPLNVPNPRGMLSRDSGFPARYTDDHSGRCPTGSTRNGTHHRVLPPVGGNGVDPGGLHKNSKKVDKRGCMQRFVIERRKPGVFGLWIKPQTNGFHEFVFIVLYFVADGSFTADGGLLQPTGGVKTTSQKTRFRSVNSTRNSRTGQN